MRDFQLLRRISEGAAAEVLLVRGRDDAQPSVLEVMRPEVARDVRATEKFLNEIRVRRSLSHPNLARRAFAGRLPDGRPYLKSEPLEGQTLKGFIYTRGALAPIDLLQLAIPLCEAVEHLHAEGFVHGNLQPSTVFLNGALGFFTPKLFDFGLALLRTGSARGSATLVEPEYLAPERVQGHRGSFASDIYSMGVLLYEAAAGFPPFTSGAAEHTRQLQLKSPVPPLPSTARPLMPVVRRCMEKSPEDRYPTVAALRFALEEMQGSLVAMVDTEPIAPLLLTKRKH